MVKGFSFVIDNNITGGYLNGWQYYGTDSTELISFSPPLARKGPITLPYRVREHCTVLIGDYVYLIGGHSATFKDSIKKVLAIDIHNGAMRYMADMSHVRRSHTCSTISRGNKTLIIVAGGIESTTSDPPSWQGHIFLDISRFLQRTTRVKFFWTIGTIVTEVK